MISFLPFEEVRTFTRVDNTFVNSFMPLAPEGYVKVYLYGLMLSERGAQEFDIAGALGMREDEILKAYLYWQAQGLVRLIAGERPGVEYLEISKGQRHVFEAANDYGALFGELQKCFGSRMLSANELSKVKDWIEVYALSEAAVLMLVRYCVENNERGNKVSINYIDAAARSWADMGIKSAKEAEEHIAARALQKGGASAVLKRLNKLRPPTQDELAMYSSWIEQGFSEEAILLACSQLTAYGTPSFKALDNVLSACLVNGLSSEAAIEEYLKREEQDKAFAALFFSRLGVARAISRQERELLYSWRHEWHMTDELILYAADCSHGEAQRFASAKRRLQLWHDTGVASLARAKEEFEKEKSSPPAEKRGKDRSFNYMQRSAPVSADNFMLSLDDDEE